MKQFTIMASEVSDGHHTFDELYEHRCWLWINLCLANVEDCYWFDHFDGWPCLVWNSPAGQMSYHVPAADLLKVSHKIKKVTEREHKFDGHSSEDVVLRLEMLANCNAQGSGKSEEL